MAVTKIFNNIDLDGAIWTAISLNNHHSFFLISVAQDDKIKSITFAIAVDSGVTNNPLQYQYITLPVNEGISGIRFSGFPDDFYIKPVQVTLKNEDVVKENIDATPFDIEININPMDFA